MASTDDKDSKVTRSICFHWHNSNCPRGGTRIPLRPAFARADPGFDQGGGPDCDRPKTAILGPQFCRILVLGPHFWWSRGGPDPRGPPGSAHDLAAYFS